MVDTGWAWYSKAVATPKLPPPPRSAQNRSWFCPAFAVTIRPSAVTTSTASRLSMVRPYLPISQPSPPPRVSPAIPVVETTPPVVASPWQAAARLSSFQVTPPCAQTVRLAGSTRIPFIGARSIIRPPSVTARPATPWPPPRTEISVACSRPMFTASTMSGTVRHRAMSAGRLSIRPLCTLRVCSYAGSAGPISSPVNDARTSSGTPIVLLLVDASQVVPAGRVIDELWGAALPAEPRAALRTQVSRLRRALRPARGDLVTLEGGYRLALQRSQLDAARFEDALAEATQVSAEQALGLLDEALALWRGPAIGEFADRPFALAAAVRLDELRVVARERRAELLLSAGLVDDAVAALQAIVAEHPGREHARGLFMQALYRGGRHTDALATFRSRWRHRIPALGP